MLSHISRFLRTEFWITSLYYLRSALIHRETRRPSAAAPYWRSFVRKYDAIIPNERSGRRSRPCVRQAIAVAADALKRETALIAKGIDDSPTTVNSPAPTVVSASIAPRSESGGTWRSRVSASKFVSIRF